MVGMTMFLILAASGECSASALPSPIVEPPPTETCESSRQPRLAGMSVLECQRTQQSTFSSFAFESASCVT